METPWTGTFSEVQHWYLLAEDPELTAVLKRSQSELDDTASVYVRMKDSREFLLIEGGRTFAIQRTDQKTELGQDIVALVDAAAPVGIHDDLIAERRRVHSFGKEMLQAVAEGRVLQVRGIRGSVIPETVQNYLDKPVEEQRKWIELEATTEEWNLFLEAIKEMPEPEQTVIWSLYVMRLHSDVVDSRHPSRAPRGTA